MRMLMGDNEPYVDGKAQRRPSQDEPSNKRALSPSIHNEKIGYLIRDALYRTHPTIPKDNGKSYRLNILFFFFYRFVF